MSMTIQDKSKKMAVQHWRYIESLLTVSMLDDENYTFDMDIAMCRFHYITAWEHGAKHYAELMDGRN